MSNKTRAAAFKERMQAQGLRQVNVWVPADKAANIQILAEMLRDNEALDVGPLRDTLSGKLVRLG